MGTFRVRPIRWVQGTRALHHGWIELHCIATIIDRDEAIERAKWDKHMVIPASKFACKLEQPFHRGQKGFNTLDEAKAGAVIMFRDALAQFITFEPRVPTAPLVQDLPPWWGLAEGTRLQHHGKDFELHDHWWHEVVD